MFGPETFIVRIADDAMAPRVRAGDYVWIDPDEPAVDGRLVAVRDPGRGQWHFVNWRILPRDYSGLPTRRFLGAFIVLVGANESGLTSSPARGIFRSGRTVSGSEADGPADREPQVDHV